MAVAGDNLPAHERSFLVKVSLFSILIISYNYFSTGGIILFMTSGFYYALCGLVAGGLYFLRNWSQGKRCEVFARLDGKIVVITGGNTGNFLDVYFIMHTYTYVCISFSE